MPNERAFTAATRLSAQFPDREALLRELRRLGYPEDEARIAANAVKPPEVFHGDELKERDLKQRGYLLLLTGAPCLAAGILGALISDSPLAALVALALGVTLVGLGVRTFWQARGV
jgi:hypothetical protein